MSRSAGWLARCVPAPGQGRGASTGHWGFAARGSLVEAGGPPLVAADLDERVGLWTDLAPKLYAQAAASQWDPATAVDWSDPELPGAVEAAVVQLMTYLVENEHAALPCRPGSSAVSTRTTARSSQFLATQIADEARHVEVFSRRASLTGGALGVSSVRWPCLTSNAPGRARLGQCLVLAVGARRGHLPLPLGVHRSLRP